MRTLVLTNNKVALIDDEFYNDIVDVPWYAKQIRGKWYAMRSIKTAHGRSSEMLQRYVYKLAHGSIPIGQQVRFKNHNFLDCRINNLTLPKKYLKRLEAKSEPDWNDE